MDQVPVAGRTAEARCADIPLPAGVGQRVGGAPGQDHPLRHLMRPESGVEMVEPSDLVLRKQRIRGQADKERLEDGENRWCKEVLWKDVKRAQTL